MSACIYSIQHHPNKSQSVDYMKNFLIGAVLISWTLTFLSISYVCFVHFRDSTVDQSSPKYRAAMKNDVPQTYHKAQPNTPQNTVEERTAKVPFEETSKGGSAIKATKQVSTMSIKRVPDKNDGSLQSVGTLRQQASVPEPVGNKQADNSPKTGEVRSMAFQLACLDASAVGKSNKVSTYACHGLGGNQEWLLNEHGELKRDNLCADYFGGPIALLECHGGKGNQMWEYDYKTRTMRHANSKSCITVTHTGTLDMAPCDENNIRQRWIWSAGRYNLHSNNNDSEL